MDLDDDQLDRMITEAQTLQDYIKKLTDDLEAIKGMLRQLGPGEHWTASGQSVIIRPPNRKFNARRALSMVAPEDQQACLQVVVDPQLVKEHLSEAQIDQCMEPGRGKEVVVIK